MVSPELAARGDPEAVAVAQHNLVPVGPDRGHFEHNRQGHGPRRAPRRWLRSNRHAPEGASHTSATPSRLTFLKGPHPVEGLPRERVQVARRGRVVERQGRGCGDHLGIPARFRLFFWVIPVSDPVLEEGANHSERCFARVLVEAGRFSIPAFDKPITWPSSPPPSPARPASGAHPRRRELRPPGRDR